MRAIHWFRADLRLRDNPALAAAARQAERVVPVFVLDPRLLEGASAGSARTAFLLDCLERLGEELEASGCPLVVRRGAPEVEIPKLLGETGAELLKRTAQSKGIDEASQPFGRVTHKQHRREPGNGPRRNRPRLSQPLVRGRYGWVVRWWMPRRASSSRSERFLT